MPIRQYVASFLPSGVIDRGKLSAQEALAQITIGFTLAQCGQNKGRHQQPRDEALTECFAKFGTNLRGL
jgi:hypothetical protein